MEKTLLCQRTEDHHIKCLRDMFRQYYEPCVTGKKNKYWTIGLPVKVMNKFRVHLSWELGHGVFHCNDETVGRKILRTLNPRGKKKSGVSQLKLHKLVPHTKKYHKRRLIELFRIHYEPCFNDENNNYWTVHLPEEVKEELRLHLSWEIGCCLVHLDNLQLGVQILVLFSKDNLGILPFLKHVIKNRKMCERKL